VKAGLDRRSYLQLNSTVVGLDYIFVDATNQTDVYVHFIGPPTIAQQSEITRERVSITATAGDAPRVLVDEVMFLVVKGELVLRVRTAAPGGFTRYTLRLDNPPVPPLIVDPHLASLDFSFKAGCPTDVDCDEGPLACPPEPQVDFPVDYEARDFFGLRTALLDFASQRYPRGVDRLEADSAVMLAEVMSALGDELAYHQDRIAREAHLETATQRRSLRRHAQLVNYPIHDGLGASTWIDVTALADGALEAGTALQAIRDGAVVSYAIGHDLGEMLPDLPTRSGGKLYDVKLGRNDELLVPYQWDIHEVCLPVGATELDLAGDVTAALKPFDDAPEGRPPGRWLLLRTDPVDPGVPPRRHLVRVIDAVVVRDPLTNVDTTHLTWEPAQKLPFAIELAELHVHGNLVPAIAGRRMQRRFMIRPTDADLPASDLDPPWAVERLGANGTVAFLFSLEGSDTEGLVRRGAPTAPKDPRGARPEVHLVEQISDGGTGEIDGPLWDWRPAFVGASGSSLALHRDYILDDGTWRRVVGYQRPSGEVVHVDYAANDGCTIRFGDGVFGRVPARGTRFLATYLVGNGRRANVPAGAITHFDQPTALADAFVKSIVAAVDNPFVVDSGLDPESPETIRQLAPEAFRAVTYRAVRPEDYAEAAERLPWVQRAGCSFRWTGSWQTAFVTPDPRASVEITDDERAQLEAQLDRFRQAGRETHALDPRYVDLDLEIGFCVAPDAYPAEVKVRVLAALSGSPGAFFSADHFTFGTPLERSLLEAAIQRVPGVRAVETISHRRRGYFDWTPFTAMAYQPALDEVIRVENDPLHPDRGSVKLYPEGGA
jgi:hypothetical protein